VFEKVRDDCFDGYRNVDEYDAVLRWHCRLDEAAPRLKDSGEKVKRKEGGSFLEWPFAGKIPRRDR
jgi:hypothetical protein